MFDAPEGLQGYVGEEDGLRDARSACPTPSTRRPTPLSYLTCISG